MVFALGAVFVALGVEGGRGQTVTLITTNTTWRYNQSGTNLGTAWLDPGYDDTAAGWAGPGLPLFGFETTPSEYFDTFGLLFQTDFGDPQNPTTNFRTNYYFRTHFNMPSFPDRFLTNATLTTTNWIDDGAIIYLNGVELFRFNMPSGPVGAATFANPPLAEPIRYITNNLGSSLIAGDNVLAVELHQSATSSSDDVFGMTMFAVLPNAPVITNQPIGQTNVIGATNVLLSVGAIGTAPLYYQWYSNNTAIAGATNVSLSGLVTAKTNTANYYVVVSNPIDTATSAVATVAIVRDTFPPIMLSAVAGPPPSSLFSNQVLVTFNERLSSSTAAAASNYIISILGTGNFLQVTTAQHSVAASTNVSLVKLSCSNNLVFGVNYVLTVNRVADTNGNVILPNSQIGITFNVHAITNLIPMGQLWVWDENGDDPGTAWKEVDYVVPPTWGEPSSGFFYWTPGVAGPPVFPCASGNPTPLGGYIPSAYYFRTHFNFPSNLASSGTLRFTHVLDDGAIFYLNGVEIYRYNIVPGPVGPSSPSYIAVGVINCLVTNIAVTNLAVGDNVLAAELHQSGSPNDFDAVFGTTVDYDYPITSPLPPRLVASRSASDTVLSWSNVAYLTWGLESAGELGTNATWTPLSTSSPYTNHSAAPQFFRLRAP